VPLLTPPWDFSAWFEVTWTAGDVRRLPQPARIGRADYTGPDATDVAITTSFGSARLSHFES
jgi:hypothetical protein